MPTGNESTSLLAAAENLDQAEYTHFATSSLVENRPLFNKDLAESIYRRLVDNATVPGQSTKYLPEFLKNFHWIKSAIETLRLSDTQQILDFLKRLQKLRDKINPASSKGGSSEKSDFSAAFSEVTNSVVALVENSCPNLQNEILQSKNKQSYDRVTLEDSDDIKELPESPKTSKLVNPIQLFTKAFAQSIYEVLIGASRKAAEKTLVSPGQMFNLAECKEIKDKIESAQYAETQDVFFNAYKTIFQKMEESSYEFFKKALEDILFRMRNYVFSVDPLLPQTLTSRSMGLSASSAELVEAQMSECAKGAGCFGLATIRPACLFWLFEVPCIAAQPVPLINLWWISVAAELGYLAADCRILTRKIEGTREPIPTPFNIGRDRCSRFFDNCDKEAEVVNEQRVLATVVTPAKLVNMH